MLIKKNFSSNQHGGIVVILGILVVVIFASVGSYYLGTQQNRPEQLSSVTPSDSPSALPSETIVPKSTMTAAVDTKKYLNRFFNPAESWFREGGEKYPTELTQIESSGLIPLSCTPVMTATDSSGDIVYQYYNEETKLNDTLTDSVYLNYIDQLNKINTTKTTTQINEIVFCSTKEETAFIMYGLGPCGGGCSGIPYVAVAKNSKVSEVGKIEDNMAYFGCREPLQLTKDAIFYFRCGGGDGPSGSASIFKLSLDDLKLSRLRYCLSSIDAEEKPFTQCK